MPRDACCLAVAALQPRLRDLVVARLALDAEPQDVLLGGGQPVHDRA